MSSVRQRTTNGNGNATAHTNGNAKTKPSEPIKTIIKHYQPTEHGRAIDKKMDEHTDWEFGGPWGVCAMMIGFPLLMCEFGWGA